MIPIEQFDVVIIGAGPAGSSAATFLAQHGHRVALIEKEKFPRYHVGESMLPFTFEPLKRLGLIDIMHQSAFIKKYSVQFVSPSGKASQPFYFFDRYPGEIAQTWQVLRSEFDLILLNNARTKGVEVFEQTAVREIIRDDGRVVGVRAAKPNGVLQEFRAPLTMDCTGRDAFSAIRNGWRKGDPYLNKVAVWTYYKGAQRDAGIEAGGTTVALIENKGWFWYIPLHDDIISVGVVAEGKYLSRDGVKAPKAIFDREIEQNQWIKSHLAQGVSQGQYYITGEYSYHSQHCAEEGLVLVGDAFCFLDPVFSSGLLLALKSGMLAADAVNDALVAKDYGSARFAEYGAALRFGIENMRKLIYAFYNPAFSFREVTDRYPDLAGDITDCLSGEVNKDFSRLFAAVSEFVELPDALPYGTPAPVVAREILPA